MHAFAMIFIRTSPGIDWAATGDDLANVGYESCKLLAPVPLKSIDLEVAKAEAAARWREYLEDMHTEHAAGYWVVSEDDKVIRHVHVTIESEDRLK